MKQVLSLLCFMLVMSPAMGRGVVSPASTTRLVSENRILGMSLDEAGVVRDLWMRDGVRFFGSDQWVVRQFLMRYQNAFGVEPSALVLDAQVHVSGGTVLRFRQTRAGKPVFRGCVVAEVAGGRAVLLANRTDRQPELTREPAFPDRQRVLKWLGTDKTVQTTVLHRLEWGYFQGRPAVLVWVSGPEGDWEKILDAENGRELFRRNLRHDDHLGYVYETNPISVTGDTSLTDMDDAATVVLNDARSLVELAPPSPSGQLKNQYVDLSAPGITPGGIVGYYPGMAMGEDGRYFYDRDDFRFEEVNVYYWITRASTRIGQELGFPEAVNYPVPVNAHFMAADNSYYLETDRGLHFGDGGVDDAEDAEIILHEFGHAVIHNLVPGLGGSWESSALDEGTCDYVAAAFGEDPNFPDTIGEWDASAYDASGQEPPRLRPIVTDRVYPDNMREPYPQPWSNRADYHWDGVIWSATLWQAREHIGADEMDRVVLRGITSWYPDINFNGAGLRLLNADQALYNGAHSDTLRYLLTRRGILPESYRTLPAPDGQPYRLVFPLPRKTSDTRASIGVVNLGSGTANVTYRVIGDNGARVYQPVTISIPERGRLFADPLKGRTLDGCWVLLECDEPVAGYTHILEGAGEPDKAAFIPAGSGNADRLIVPHIATTTDYWDTTTTLVHAGNTPMTVRFEDGGAGLSIPEVQEAYLLDHWDWLTDRYGGAFPTGFSGWGQLTADSPEMAGMELFGKKGEGLAQLAGLNLDSTVTDHLVFAHVAANTAYWWTGMVVCNTSDQPVTVWLTAMSETGEALGTVSFQLDAGGKRVGLVPDFWTTEGASYPADTAWIDLQANAPVVAGVELFGTLPESGDRLLAGLAPAAAGSMELLFPHVDADTENYWTGIAMVNMGTEDAGVTVTSLDNAGTVLATRVLPEPMPAGGKIVLLARDLFEGGLPDGTTQIRVNATQLLVGFELWGNLTPRQDHLSGMLAVPVVPEPFQLKTIPTGIPFP